ncbi:hypothetical protein TFLX_04158 [Thermoflexales bacterium]|nr:hypothetical protein TFLX_04158 [Thermoflexales bacterium]
MLLAYLVGRSAFPENALSFSDDVVLLPDSC